MPAASQPQPGRLPSTPVPPLSSSLNFQMLCKDDKHKTILFRSPTLIPSHSGSIHASNSLICHSNRLISLPPTQCETKYGRD